MNQFEEYDYDYDVGIKTCGTIFILAIIGLLLIIILWTCL